MKWYRHTHSGEYKKFSDKQYALVDPNYWVRVEGHREAADDGDDEETTVELVKTDA